MKTIQYHSNKSLKTILPEWNGNPVINGRFIDPNKKFSGSFSKFLKWRFTKNDKGALKKADTWRLEVIKNSEFLHQTNNCIVWLGHASFFIQVNGIRIITDPVFGKISGVVPRLSELPCSITDFKKIDYVLLSHAHRDHCDESSLKKLAAQNNFTLLTSLNTGKLVASWINGLLYQEAGWYQQYQLKESNFNITFLPTQHWSNRYGWDTNETLWGSFMIQADGINIYFGGDSGYCNYHKQIATLFPNIDIAILGVGAYHPAFMMQDVHTNPHEAVQVFHDLKAKTLVPMHFGTFDLADEPLSEPYYTLQQLEKEKNIQGQLKLLSVGEVMVL